MRFRVQGREFSWEKSNILPTWRPKVYEDYLPLASWIARRLCKPQTRNRTTCGFLVGNMGIDYIGIIWGLYSLLLCSEPARLSSCELYDSTPLHTRFLQFWLNSFRVEASRISRSMVGLGFRVSCFDSNASSDS